MKARPEPMAVWRRRIPWVIAALGLLISLVVARAVELQVLQRDFLLGQGEQRQARSVAIPAHRGMILDRHGKPLAISTPVDSVWVEPAEFIAAQARWGELAKLLDLPLPGLKRKMAAAKAREFVYVQRHITPELGQQVLALGIPGVNLQREYRRYYPSGEVAGHVVGFTNIDDRGQEGLELAFDSWLSGKPGSKRMLQDRLGRAIKEVGIQRPAEPGQDLTLSIDERLQYLAYRELKKAVFQHQARSGSMVLLDADSGEVLAMVNQPAFNPNDRSRHVPGSFRNRAVTDVFEPGSTMKAFSVAAVLNKGKVRADTAVDTSPGYIKIGRYTVRDHRNLGVVSVTDIIRESSNVGATRLALSLSANELWSMYSGAGLGASSGSQFPGEVGGLLAPPKSWGQIEQATLSYGYGLSVTALQLARAYAAIAADGVLPDISFQKREQAVTGQRLMPAKVAKAVRGMLETVVSSTGTGTLAAIPGYRVAGKTGTSKKSAAGGYADDRYVSVFAGMAPASNPKLVAVVVIDDPRGEDYYGGKVAAPVFSAVVGGALRLLDVPPDALPALQAQGQQSSSGGAT